MDEHYYLAREGGEKMHDIQNVSFEELGERELLKGGAWWVGLIAAVATAAYAYCETTGQL
jgi:hypothetical protein